MKTPEHFEMEHPYPIFIQMKRLENRAVIINHIVSKRRISDDTIDSLYDEAICIQEEFERLFDELKPFLN